MKTKISHIIISLLVVLLCSVSISMAAPAADTCENIPLSVGDSTLSVGESISGATHSKPTNTLTTSDSISIFTLVVNAFNNALTNENNKLSIIAIAIAILTIIITLFGVVAGIMGIIQFRLLKVSINENTKRVGEELSIIEKLKEEVNKNLPSIERLDKGIKYQNKCTEKINLYLYKITNTIVDNYDNGGPGSPSSTPTNSKHVRETLLHDYNMVVLFLPYSKRETEAAFDYIAAYKTLDDINDLEEIANTDPDERKRNRAREVIGYIRGRLDQEAKPDDTMVNADR